MNTRTCLHCNKELIRKRRPLRIESNRDFYKRRFCDPICQRAYQKENPIEYRSNREELSRHYYNALAAKFKKESCETCGAKEELCVHHEDRDFKNNDPSNLKTLCRPCHFKHHLNAGDIVQTGPQSPCRICGKPFDKKAGSRGDLCNAHRLQMQRHGEIRLKRANAKEPKPCTVCGKVQVLTKGFCNSHYLRFKRHGDPMGGGSFRPKG